MRVSLFFLEGSSRLQALTLITLRDGFSTFSMGDQMDFAQNLPICAQPVSRSEGILWPESANMWLIQAIIDHIALVKPEKNRRALH
jgi:hypothetical protein